MVAGWSRPQAEVQEDLLTGEESTQPIRHRSTWALPAFIALAREQSRLRRV